VLTQPTSILGTQTKVVFDQEEFDLNNEYTNGIFAPAESGYYAIDCQVEYQSSNVAGAWSAVIAKNGVAVAAADYNGNAVLGFAAPLHALLKLAKGEKVTCLTAQTTGASQPLAISAYPLNVFSAARVY
jgi:hypothetical protein